MPRGEHQSSPGCALCGAPLGAGPGQADPHHADPRYCCTGCARVAEILQRSGHRGDFRQSAAWLSATRAGLVPVDGAAGLLSSSFQTAPRSRPLGKPGLEQQDSAARPPARGAQDNEWRQLCVGIRGMWCPSCGWLVEQVLRARRGVESARVAFLSDQLTVRYQPAVVGPEDLQRAVEELGYRVVDEAAMDDERPDRGLLLRFGLAAFLGANVMVLSYALYAHRGSLVTEEVARILPFILMGLAAPVVFGAGSSILGRAWRALRAGGLTMDSLIALGALSAFGASAAATLAGSDEVYFDGACAVVTFWLLGRLLEQVAFRNAARAGTAVRRLLPRKARLLDGEGARWVPAGGLEPGQRIRVAPGERVPVDGRVVEGRGHVGTAVVDGEPRARPVAPGSRVPGGSTCGEASLDLEVLAPASRSMLARIAHHVALASGRDSDRAQVVDAIARLFVPLVLVLALVTGSAWMAAGLAPSLALKRALSVLVVSCPCALGVAAPLARVLVAGALARRGIIARGHGALDRLATTRRAVFDKTGTLTQGRLSLVWSRVHGMELDEAIAMARALERRSAHPVALALRRARIRHGEPDIREIQVVDGLGVSGLLENRPAHLGRCGWVQEQAGAPAPLSLLRAMAGQEREGRTVVMAHLGPGRWLALAFDDPPRPDARPMLRELERAGMDVVVLSGDSQAATGRLAASLGISQAIGGCLPRDKARWLEEKAVQDGHRAVFVGDGINDAPAMAVSVGVAVASGTDFARETAAVLLLEPDLRALPQLVMAARRMRRVTLQNLAWAGLYNALALPAAVTGLLSPVLAAAAMVTSGLAVTVNALRLRSLPRRGDTAARADTCVNGDGPEVSLPSTDPILGARASRPRSAS